MFFLKYFVVEFYLGVVIDHVLRWRFVLNFALAEISFDFFGRGFSSYIVL